MFQFIYEWWVESCPFLSEYGSFPYIVLTIISIIAFIRFVIIYPLYALGNRKRF